MILNIIFGSKLKSLFLGRFLFKLTSLKKILGPTSLNFARKETEINGYIDDKKVILNISFGSELKYLFVDRFL